MKNEQIIHSVSENWFRLNHTFYLNNAVEHNAHIFQITNERLDRLQKIGLQVQYQIHCNDEKAFIRLCCHSFPYWEFSGAGKEYLPFLKRFYSIEQAEKIYAIRKRLKTAYLAFGKQKNSPYYYGERYNDDYLWLVEYTFSNTTETTIFTESMRFIADTYPQLENVLRETGIDF
ncbi:MAG: hypothetical protein J6U60_01720 [Clostridia bacterium]|nr:hypothetical protein [Clostridia bacterium]